MQKLITMLKDYQFDNLSSSKIRMIFLMLCDEKKAFILN